MATQTDSQTPAETEAQSTNQTPSGIAVGESGAVAGLIGGIIMGIVLSILVPSFLLEMAPALYDLQGGIAGWFAHAVHSTIFGVLFALLLVKSPLRRYAGSIGMNIVLGIVWGILLWIVATGIVMPVWLKITYFTEAPLVPYLRPPLLLAHLAYGVVIGILLNPLISTLETL